MSVRPALAFALLVVTAGCVAPVPGDTTLDEGTPVVTQDGPETPVSTAEPRPNPWNESTLTVAVDAGPLADREAAAHVRAAAAFWSDHGDLFAGYDADFAVDPDAAEPDAVVQFVGNVTACDDVSHAAGCAPLIHESGDIDRPETVTVEAGLSNASTEHVVRHELGHLLGIEHGEAPREVMRANATLETVPRPDATERAFPWPDRSLSVFLAVDGDTDRRQVGHALDYYERGPDGVPANLSLTTTDNRSAADIVVRRGDCGGTAASCFTVRGPDPDGDDTVEQYHRAVITLDGVPADAVGWHVGNWLAYLFGAEEPAERPEPFRNASPEDRRDRWWEDG
ncbi:hypothetical protein JCM30237_28040 [Halolamina litorea]|uniref:Matrixin family metalloprotease n=1 Tax=Halolamina litorea TaxID=1515593 RepID=A0ABD6BT28_9EURY|nr:matrixin family metalloprotease [Halolamina litorea]